MIDVGLLAYKISPRLSDWALRKRYRAIQPYSDVAFSELPSKDMQIKIGRHSTSFSVINLRHTSLYKHSVEIGSYTQIASDLEIWLSSGHTPKYVSNNMSGLFVKGSHVEHALRHYKKYKDENYGSIKIGNDVWIGMDVIIRGNANIGDGAVVAARSFVRESVPPYAVVGGSPAKLLKWRFDKKTRDSLCRIKWWNWSDEKIAEHIDEFYDPKAFVRRYDRR